MGGQIEGAAHGVIGARKGHARVADRKQAVRLRVRSALLRQQREAAGDVRLGRGSDVRIALDGEIERVHGAPERGAAAVHAEVIRIRRHAGSDRLPFVEDDVEAPLAVDEGGVELVERVQIDVQGVGVREPQCGVDLHVQRAIRQRGGPDVPRAGRIEFETLGPGRDQMESVAVRGRHVGQIGGHQ